MPNNCNQHSQKIINIALIGDHNVGKTAFIHRLLTCDFLSQHSPTLQDDFGHIISIYDEDDTRAQHFPVFHIYEFTFIPDNFDSQKFDYVIGICAFDSKSTLKYLTTQIKKLKNEHNIDYSKIICLINKVDIPIDNLASRISINKNVNFYNKNKIQILRFSVRSGYNLYKPFEIIAEQSLNA